MACRLMRGLIRFITAKGPRRLQHLTGHRVDLARGPQPLVERTRRLVGVGAEEPIHGEAVGIPAAQRLLAAGRQKSSAVSTVAVAVAPHITTSTIGFTAAGLK